MFGLPILEVAVGLSFVYLLLALICTAVNETIAGITRRRADFLKKGIDSLLGDDPDLKKKLFEHPLIASLGPKKDAKPSYLSASKFALALMDIVTGTGKDTSDPQALREGIPSIKNVPLRTSLSAVLADSPVDLDSGSDCYARAECGFGTDLQNTLDQSGESRSRYRVSKIARAN